VKKTARSRGKRPAGPGKRGSGKEKTKVLLLSSEKEFTTVVQLNDKLDM